MPEGYDSWGVPDSLGGYYGPQPSGPGFPAGLWIDVTPAGPYVGPPAPPQPNDVGPPVEYPEFPTDEAPPYVGPERVDTLPGDTYQPIVIPGEPGAGPPGDSVPAYPPWDPGEEPAGPDDLPRVGAPTEPTRVPETGIIHHPYDLPGPSVLRTSIVEGERTFGGPRVSPFPNEPVFNAPGEEFRVERRIGTRLERSDEYYRREARRMVEDTIRRQLPRVIEGIATRAAPSIIGGAIGGIIGGIIRPGELGSGEMIPGFDAPMPAPPDIPAPIITQPEVPWPTPLPAPLPVPSAPPSSAPSPPSMPGTPSSTVGGPAPNTGPSPRPASSPASATPSVPWGAIASIVGTLLTPRSRRSQWTLPRSSPSVTPEPTISPLPLAPSPLPSPLPAPSATPTPTTSSPPASSSPLPTPTPTGNPLTGVEPQVSSSTPLRTSTRQRTRECKCEHPKKRKKARECIVRGNLQWVSGPKKGKPAGSRCVKF